MKPVALFPGCVYAMGREAESAARLYAQLTGRRYKAWNIAANLQDCDVVACTSAALTPDLLRRICRENSGGIPGLICASTPVELENTCIRQAERLSLASRVISKRIFLYPKADFGLVEHSTDVFIGGAQPDGTLTAWLDKSPAMLVVVDRSDGLPHLFISRHKFACPFLSTGSPPGDLLPVCQVQKRCTKLPYLPEIGQAQLRGDLVPMSTLRAGIGLIYTCGVLELQSGIVDPAYSLATALLSQSNFAAVITTWRNEDDAADGAHLNSLLNDLSSGVSAGVATGKFNRSDHARRLGIQLCVLGDPCVALEKTAFPRLPDVLLEPLGKPATVTSSSIAQEARMLEAAVQAALRVSGSYDVEKGDRVLSFLSSAAQTDRSFADFAAEDRDLLDFIGGLPWLDRFLGRVGERITISEAGTCPNCHAAARVRWMQFSGYGAAPRRIIQCPCCGDSSCMPPDWDLSLDLGRLRERVLGLSGLPERACARLYISTCQETYGAFDWLASNGTLEPFRLPEQLPAEPLSCVVVAVRRLQLGAVSVPVRQLSDGTLSFPGLERRPPERLVSKLPMAS